MVEVLARQTRERVDDSEISAAVDEIVARRLDPWTAAEQLVDPGAGSGR
jgi:hypothetical protein